jgi:hypothetical protein
MSTLVRLARCSAIAALLGVSASPARTAESVQVRSDLRDSLARLVQRTSFFMTVEAIRKITSRLSRWRAQPTAAALFRITPVPTSRSMLKAYSSTTIRALLLSRVACTACGRRSLETNPREIPSFALVSRTATPRRFPVEPLNRRSQQNRTPIATQPEAPQISPTVKPVGNGSSGSTT